jgi:hypothetical protein
MSDTAFALPSAEASLAEARRRLAHTLSRDELVWTASERYDDPSTTWFIEVVRQGAQGRWVRQRHKYDAQAATLYFLGESALGDEEFRQARRAGQAFDVAALQR